VFVSTRGGGTRLSRTHLRSLSLRELLPVLRFEGVQFVDG